MEFKIELAQNSFKDGALLVSLPSTAASDITCYKYDIRVVANDFAAIGTDAVATNVVINDFIITSTPSSFAIPINAATMSDGQKYKVTIRLYTGTPATPSIYSYTTPNEKLFYYDTRVYTILPVSVSSISSEPSKFNIANVVLCRDSAPLLSTDPFFTDVGVSNIVMSCTSIVKTINKFNTGTEYSLGSNTFDRANSDSKSYDFLITSEMNQVETASAYELWGYLSLSSQFTFGINIVAKGGQNGDVIDNDTTVGYVINNPEINLALGDVIGAVSENPISVTLTNWSHYNTYKFDTLTLEIYDASSNLLLKNALDNPLVYTKQYSDFNANTGVVHFSSSDLLSATNETPLKNGVTYKFKTILNFTSPLLYKPTLDRSATDVGQFSDSISPINSYGVAKNSWELIPSKGAGLIVSFRKTDQFYGLSNRPYNLEGNTTVTAEYRTFNTPTGEWLGWTALSGGSISQSTFPDGLDATNTNGVYDVPVHNENEQRGNNQSPVFIYAEIPGLQAKYSALQIRLRLITTNTAFSTKTSTDYLVPRVDGSTYKNNQVVDDNVTFRYHPKPVTHNFANDKPICTSAGANISFDVPLTIYPFYTAIVTTSDGVCDGSVANITNLNTYDVSNNLWNLSVARIGTGLSYTPANATFTLKVKYVSSETDLISSDEQSMTVQRQGFPSNSFSITNCRWDSVNQEVDYALAISATSTSADRMDGWNVYTSAPDASGNLIKDASGNEVSLRQSKFKSDGLTQSVTLTGVSYLDYKTITVKFVATRSLYLDAMDTSNQVETIGAGVRDTKQTPVTKLPAVLPRINSADITLENMVYNVITGGSQIAKLSANFPSNAVGLQITDKSVTSPDGIIDNQLVRTIALTNSVVERKYEIKAKYYSVDTPTVQYVYSLPVTVTFKTSTSNRIVPVIKSKSYSNSKFTVTYDSLNSGDWLNSNTILVSNVYVKKTGLNGSDTLVGSNDGSVDISVFNGDNVDMYVQDEFTTTYTVDNLSQPSVVQLVKSPSVAFVLAANPQIDESSIVVDGSNNVIKFNVNNMGTPVLHNAMLVASQDSTIDENDQGYYALAYFDNSTTGFLSSSVETNKLTISGANASQTLSITETGTGMNKITTITFSPIALANANPVNLVLLVRNKTEGSDSCAVANKAISP